MKLLMIRVIRMFQMNVGLILYRLTDWSTSDTEYSLGYTDYTALHTGVLLTHTTAWVIQIIQLTTHNVFTAPCIGRAHQASSGHHQRL